MDDGEFEDFSAGSGGGSLSAIPVVAGDHLYFIVGPKAGDATGDRTGMNLRIAGVPTSIRLRSLAVTRGPHGVDVRWRTAAEAGVLGYNVFRGVRGPPTKVNRALIAARGTAAGSVYRLVDRPGARVYRLEAVRVDGTRMWIGIARLDNSAQP
ncbi:MAG: hypothetical protein ABR521_05525 [Gaiellaceae bacterium]